MIGGGLALLLAAVWWPTAPVTTGMALVALGATGATIGRVERAGAPRWLFVAHLFVYASLYLLFVGAVCDAAMRGPQGGVNFLQGVDFVVSAAVMGLAARSSLAAMAGLGANVR